MIIRRQLYSQNKIEMRNGMELKPIFNKSPESNSESGGNAIVKDFEDLLKPIQRSKHNEEMNGQNSQSYKERNERNLWRNDEVMEMLYTMQEVKALEKLNDKSVKSENVFKDVELIMHRNGFIKKSHVQIWTKWKFLKSTYMTSRRNGIIPRMVPPQIYETIHQMISGLNQNLADSCSSADGDNSSPSGMVISGVEGGISDVGVTNEDDDDSFGMGHPIFGFRLGMVKSEPEDTGYETMDKSNSDKDLLNEELASTKSDKDFNEDRRDIETIISKELENVPKVLEIPHRGRGRPPKYPPAALSTPNNNYNKMPPLRVAPFAKSIDPDDNSATNRPPPPLTMPPAPRIQIASLSKLTNRDSAKFAQPKLIPKPTHQSNSPPMQQIRIAKEQTSQTRSSSTPSPSYPKMKQIPMRKTPYSLRPDRAIPDLDASLSPPPPPIERYSTKRVEEASTSKNLFIQSNSINSQNSFNRKRRNDWQDPLLSKQPRSNNIMNEDQNTSKPHDNDYDNKYGKLLQNVIIDLSSSLRKMQTEMMRDFFNKQNELLEKEHKFQMQQDRMIMKAFQEQTQDIMHSVKQLVGSMKTFKCHQQTEGETNLKQAKLDRNFRMQKKHNQKQEEYEGNDEGNDTEEEPMDDDHEMEHDPEDMYNDGEEQQDQIDEHVENQQNIVENIADEEEQSTAEQNENGSTTEDDSQNPIQ